MRQNSFDRVASLESAKRPLNKSDTKWYQKVSIAKEEFISIIQSVNTCSAFLNVNRTLWNTALPFALSKFSAIHYRNGLRLWTKMERRQDIELTSLTIEPLMRIIKSRLSNKMLLSGKQRVIASKLSSISLHLIDTNLVGRGFTNLLFSDHQSYIHEYGEVRRL